jgi:hypothetical protein
VVAVAGFIYAIYSISLGEGPPKYKVHRAAIVKETPRRIITGDTGLAFGCSRQHDPDHVHRSAQEARHAFKIELHEQRARLMERLARIDALLPIVDDIPEEEEEDR